MKPLLLIDGSNLFYRSFYAGKGGKFKSVDKPDIYKNQHLEAHIFLKKLLAAVSLYSPCAVVLFWDSSTRSKFRLNLLPTYKAHRKTGDANEQKKQALCRSVLSSVLENLCILQLTVKGVEADDLIAYFYRIFKNKNHIRILSNDGDLQQFPGSVVSDLTGKTIAVTKQSARLLLRRKIVCGDKSDNIPGITGIGPVRFNKLYADKKFSDLILEFKDRIEDIEILIRNRRLCNLLRYNDKIMKEQPDSIKYIYGCISAAKRKHFVKMMAAASMSRYGLRELSKSIPVFEANHAQTIDFCRLALLTRERTEYSLNI